MKPVVYPKPETMICHRWSGRTDRITDIIRNENPIDRPAERPDQASAEKLRSSSRSPSSRMISWIITGSGVAEMAV